METLLEELSQDLLMRSRNLAQVAWPWRVHLVPCQTSIYLRDGKMNQISGCYFILISASTKKWIVKMIYQLVLNADGCFKPDHLKMKQPDNDFWLANGHGFMEGNTPYDEHLEAAVET
jgi:hypothetical protein